MKKLLPSICVVLVFAVTASVASAHYLWIGISPQGKSGTVNLYFEEGIRAGDGKYLDPFIKRGTTWIRTTDNPQTAVLKVEETRQPGKRWLSAKLPAADGCVVDSFAMWGVYTYGKTEVLLHYYAKNADIKSAADLNKLGRSDKLAFDVVPTLDGEKMTCQVIWNGKPAANCGVKLRGPAKFRKNTKTDSDGRISFAADKKGIYTVHATLDEPDKSGEQDGKKYDIKRHHSTLVIKMPLAK